jgi:hypothetical protein
VTYRTAIGGANEHLASRSWAGAVAVVVDVAGLGNPELSELLEHPAASAAVTTTTPRLRVAHGRGSYSG